MTLGRKGFGKVPNKWSQEKQRYRFIMFLEAFLAGTQNIKPVTEQKTRKTQMEMHLKTSSTRKSTIQRKKQSEKGYQRCWRKLPRFNGKRLQAKRLLWLPFSKEVSGSEFLKTSVNKELIEHLIS